MLIDGVSYGLSAEALAERKGFVNASECPTICGGDAEKRHRLWMEKTGQAEPEDLSDVLPVQMGSYTEPFNCAWFEKATGMQVTDRQGILRGNWLRATLDGMTVYQDKPCVWEAKHIGAFSKVDDAVQRYMPQVHVQMHLAECRQAILSILHGTQNYEWVVVEFDDAYWASVLKALEDFRDCVSFNVPPSDAPVIAAKPTTFKVYDMTGQNEWASHAADWLASKTAADKFKAADKGIKALVPDDASEVTGHNIIVKRSKAGALTIKGVK
jgi:predicted phage-related endonuclease